MVARRDALKRGQGAAGGKLPSLEEDNVMREFIAVRSLANILITVSLTPSRTRGSCLSRKESRW